MLGPSPGKGILWIRRRGLFRADAVTGLLDAQLHGQVHLTHQVFALMVFELWCEQYLDGHPTHT